MFQVRDTSGKGDGNRKKQKSLWIREETVLAYARSFAREWKKISSDFFVQRRGLQVRGCLILLIAAEEIAERKIIRGRVLLSLRNDINRGRLTNNSILSSSLPGRGRCWSRGLKRYIAFILLPTNDISK